MLVHFRYRELKGDAELLLYQEETFKRIDVNLPLEYLRRARVFGLISNQNGQARIHGGFLVVSSGPLRCLQQIPQDVIQNHWYLKRRAHRCFEINGLWLNHKTAPRWARMVLFLFCVYQICFEIKNGKYYFVYSFDASKEKLASLYQIWTPKRVFEGLVETLPGMSQPGLEIVEVSSVKNVIFGFLKNPGFFVRRFKMKKSNPPSHIELKHG